MEKFPQAPETWKDLVAGEDPHPTRLRVGHGSHGGWRSFGPQRLVTRSAGNILYELDGEPALDLYKRYLGEEAKNLPSSSLLFPLAVRRNPSDPSALVRTVLAIDEETRSMTFAGDVPEGSLAQLMSGMIDELILGAERAATQAAGGELAILVSCIGRKLLMGQRTSDEVEAVRDTLGPRCRQLGFYSYGEISPHGESGICDLHNQTMTVTSFCEI